MRKGAMKKKKGTIKPGAHEKIKSDNVIMHV